MSLRLEMLQVSRLAPRLLGESGERVVQFLQSQFGADGGCKNRSGDSDLYYTVFALEGLIALRAAVPVAAVAAYLRTFGDGEGLDFIHLACLARCWANLPTEIREQVPRAAILRRIESYRTADGGYHPQPDSSHGTVYGCFLALGAYQDLQTDMPDRMAMLDCLNRLRSGDGGYANQPGQPVGITTATAAAAALLRHLGQPVPPELSPWLLSCCHPAGGFTATPQTPIPDLLSTATALHALVGMHLDCSQLKEPCLDFIDTLWSSRGGFYGHWADDQLDSEYTYYALLALGHLSL